MCESCERHVSGRFTLRDEEKLLPCYRTVVVYRSIASGNAFFCSKMSDCSALEERLLPCRRVPQVYNKWNERVFGFECVSVVRVCRPVAFRRCTRCFETAYSFVAAHTRRSFFVFRVGGGNRVRGVPSLLIICYRDNALTPAETRKKWWEVDH